MRALQQSKYWGALGAGLAVFFFTNQGEADFLSDVGRALGKPFGGFVESLVTPSLRAVDNTLVADVDRRLDQRIAQVNRSAGELLEKTDTIITHGVGEVDGVLADRLTQADGIMAARIAQVGATGTALIDHAVGKLDGTLEKNIKLAGVEVRKSITELNKVGTERLDQVDGILESRVNQLQGVIQQSVADVDQALEDRLEQVDEISERRVGNLDVIGTRQILNLESTLTRLAGLAGMLVIVVLMLHSLGKEVWERWENAPEEGSLFRRLWSITDRDLFANFLRVIAAHAVILGVSLGVLVLVSRQPSREVATRQDALLTLHENGFEESEQILDYRTALYNASQLAIIEPTTAADYNLRSQKLKLIRDTLARPAVFERPESVGNLARQISTLNGQIKRKAQHSDPDLLTLQCYLRWQLALDRVAEASAAGDCGEALDIAGKTSAGKSFLLQKLARHYVSIQRAFPAWGQAGSPVVVGTSEPLTGLEHVQSYDALVQALDAASTKSYLELLDAQAEVLRALGKGASSTPAKGAKKNKATAPAADPRIATSKSRRQAAAKQVVEAWREFDQKLGDDPWISGTNCALGVFLLNDAVLTRALFFLAVPDADELPGKITSIEDPLIRLRVAPPRIEWMRRYLGWVGDASRNLVTYEEAKRFSAFEDQIIAFEKAFIKLKLAEAPTQVERLAAATAAADLALYVTEAERRLPLAQSLLGSEKIASERQSELESKANVRRLRLL